MCQALYYIICGNKIREPWSPLTKVMFGDVCSRSTVQAELAESEFAQREKVGVTSGPQLLGSEIAQDVGAKSH